jgi:DNA-binding NarL/FixJ family response regulator
VSGPRLLIVEDNPQIRQLLRAVVEEHDAVVVGEASEGRSAIEAAEHLALDIILMDVSMPVMGGFSAARELRRRRPGVRIIFVSHHVERPYVDEAILCGAQGYVFKASAATQLPAAVRAVMAGDSFFPMLAEGRSPDPKGN